MMNEKESSNILLEVRGITKSFYGTVVLEDINFQLPYGQVLGLVGRNGAGKSTLVKILTGAYHPDAGEILINEKQVEITSVEVANQLGIAQVFQELSLAENLSVAENIFIGNAPKNDIGLINRKKLFKEASTLLAQFNLNIKPTAIVKHLPVYQRQIIEILKALSKAPKLLILDEPTSALEESEIEILYGFISELKKKGYSIIFISHHMSEIFRIVDRVMVLLDGRIIGIFPINEIKMDRLV
jgi:ribose transport system ATP-binding protein